MGVLQCVLAEWPYLRIRLLRTRLGFWLVLLLAVVLRLDRTAAAPDPLAAVLLVAAGSASLSVAYLAGARADRLTLAVALLHPRSPGAVTAGRWLAALGGAAVPVLAASWQAGFGVVLAGLVTAATSAAWTLALAWTGGNVLVGAWLIWIVLVGMQSPESIMAHTHPGSGRAALAAALEILPGLWRYRGIATADVGATAHAALWVLVGLAAARSRVARLRATA